MRWGRRKFRIRRPHYAAASAAASEEAVWRSQMMRSVLSRSSDFPLHPHGSIMRNWNLLVLILLAVEVPLLPLQLAFVFDADLPYNPWLLWYRLWVECVLLTDTALQFCIQILPDGNAYWITDTRRIVWVYFTSDFWIDFCAVLPIKFVCSLLLHRPSNDCLLQLVNFHRLLRFSRWPRLLSSLQAHESKIIGNVLQWKHKTKRLAKAIALVLFSTHVMGCLWACLAMCDPHFSWHNFLRASNENNDFYKDIHPLRVYMCSLYWAVFTLTGIGYGDIVPVSRLEYIVANVCMLLASLTWGWVIATVVSIIGSSQNTVNDHLHVMDYANELLRDNKVEMQLSRQIREYFTKMKDVRDQDTIHDIIDELSPELQAEVVHAIHKHWIEKVWWMRKLPPQHLFMVEVSQNMKASLHTPNESIPHRSELVIVRQGLCLHGGLLLSRGDVYGQDFLLNNPQLMKPYTTLVLTFLQIFVLTRPVFDSILAHHPDIQKPIRRAFCTYAVLRGVLLQAKALKAARQEQPDISMEQAILVHSHSYLVQPLPSLRRRTSQRIEARSSLRRARRRRNSVPRTSFTDTEGDDAMSMASFVSGDTEAVKQAVGSLEEQMSDFEDRVFSRLRSVEGLVAVLKDNSRTLAGVS